MIPGKIFKSRHSKYIWRVAIAVLLIATVALWPAWAHLVGPSGSPLEEGAPPDIATLPISFEPNAGQTDPSVSFLAHAPGSTLYFTDLEVVIALQTGTDTRYLTPDTRHPAPGEPSVLRLQFIGADAAQVTSQGNPLPGRVNYIRGNDQAKWHTNIATYPSIAYGNLYPGIGLHYSGTGGHLKGTYLISAHADPSKIRWRYAGAQSTTLDDEGRLQITIQESGARSQESETDTDNSALSPQSSVLTEEAPVAWQEINGNAMPVDVRYALAGDGTISFVLGAYDPSYAVTIDPTITYSTYLGGTGFDVCVGIAVHNGNAYVTGWTNSVNFPLQNPLQPANHGGAYDVFITQLSASGSALVYSTYLGGSGWDQAQSIAVDAQGNAYLTGQTSSPDFPVFNAYQPTLGSAGTLDAFVTKLNPTGSALIYSTYLGGAGSDQGYRVAADTDGSALLTGTTYSANFPTLSPYQPSLLGPNDAFVTRFAPDGQSLTYSTYLGGTEVDYGNGIALDSLGRAYVVGYTFSTDFPVLNAFQSFYAGGSDAFVTRFNADGQSLSYSTYLGGGGPGISANDVAWVVTVDAHGSAYIAGQTMSSSFPTRNPVQPNYGGGFQDAFVSKLNAAGNDLIYSTYLGGSATDNGEGIAVDAAGQVYVGGSSNSANFPTRNPISNHGGTFMAKFNAVGTDLLFSTRFGGTRVTEYGHAMTIDAAGSIYLAGDTESVDFPVVNPFQSFNRGSWEAFISKISEVVTPTATVSPGTPTAQATPSSTNTSPPTGTPTRTPTSTATAMPSNTPQATGTPTNTNTPSPIGTPSSTNTPPPSSTSIVSPSSTNTLPPSGTPTRTPTSAPTFTTVTSTSTGTAIPVTSTPTACTLEFPDVPPGSTFYPFVRCLACRGVITGYDDGTFRPGNNATRGQISKIVSNAAGFDEDPGPQLYEDVPPASPFYQWINRLSNRGHMGGYPCGMVPEEPCIEPGNLPYFRPSNSATRGQLAKIVANAANVGGTPGGIIYADVTEDNPFYLWIMRLTGAGVMGGYPCGGEGEPCDDQQRPYFRPYNNVTRGQASKIVTGAFFPNCQTP